MTPERIAELEAVCEAATPGPWEFDPEEQGGGYYGLLKADGGPLRVHVMFHSLDFFGKGEILNAENDAAFIATARTALTEALAEIRRLQGKLDAYHQEARYQFDGALDAIRRVTERERSES